MLKFRLILQVGILCYAKEEKRILTAGEARINKSLLKKYLLCCVFPILVLYIIIILNIMFP